MNPFVFSSRFNNIDLSDDENLLTKIRKKKEQNGISILDLTNSNPTSVGLIFPSDVISHNINNSIFEKYNPTPKGNYYARETIAEYYKSRSFPVDADDVLLTSSTSESYSFLFKLLTNPGDDILIPSPGYPLFPFLSQFENINAIEYALVETYVGNWEYSLEEMKSKITAKTKLVIVVSPSNPTGSILGKSQWEEWLNWSASTQIPILLDEVFAPYSLEITDVELPNVMDAPLFILNGISKSLALPQMKLGWIHVNGKSKFKKEAKLGLELLADTYLSVNEPIQAILPELFKWSNMIQNQIKNRIKRNHSTAKSHFVDSKFLKWSAGKAGWNGILEIKSSNFKSSERLAEELLEKLNIYTHPGEWYGFDPDRLILVLSLIVPEDQFLLGIKELTSFLK